MIEMDKKEKAKRTKVWGGFGSPRGGARSKEFGPKVPRGVL